MYIEPPDDWLDYPEPMNLNVRVGGDTTIPDLLASIFELIETADLRVARVDMPEGWKSHLPLEEGFLWEAWVDHDLPEGEEAPVVVAKSSFKNGQTHRIVSVYVS